MKYKSSFTRGIKLTIFLLFLFWLVNTLVIINSNGIKDAIVSSVFMFVFVIIFISAFVKGIYIIIENNNLQYVHMFVLRRTAEVGKIKRIQKGLMSGLYPSLSLVYEKNGKEEDVKIGALTFKKDTLKQFVSDLRKQNPQIDLDQSATELIS